MNSNFNFIAGCDEAGRGSLIGPVFAATVIFSNNYSNEFIKDSKILNKSKRTNLYDIIKNDAIDFSINSVDEITIDKINILNASILAMHKALDGLKNKPDFILVDGNRFKSYHNIPFNCVVKGDSFITAISAASILAKVERDNFILKLDQQYPQYHWKHNMGYGTKEHIEALKKYGKSPYHRNSFLVKSLQQTLF